MTKTLKLLQLIWASYAEEGAYVYQPSRSGGTGSHRLPAGMSWGATLKQSPISSWQPLIWLPWRPLLVSLSAFSHKPHPFSLLNGGLTAEIAPSTVCTEYLTVNMKCFGKTSTTFRKVRALPALWAYNHKTPELSALSWINHLVPVRDVRGEGAERGSLVGRQRQRRRVFEFGRKQADGVKETPEWRSSELNYQYQTACDGVLTRLCSRKRFVCGELMFGSRTLSMEERRCMKQITPSLKTDSLSDLVILYLLRPGQTETRTPHVHPHHLRPSAFCLTPSSSNHSLDRAPWRGGNWICCHFLWLAGQNCRLSLAMKTSGRQGPWERISWSPGCC